METTRVLLVDDEEDLVFTLAERLQLRGMHAEAATSGEAALERVQNSTYDVAVIDVKMPGMDGLETIKRIHEMFPALPVIILTGRTSREDNHECMREGAFVYLMKPIDIEELVTIITKATQR
jgi:DNA-binding NtrC family response regulator